MILPPPPELDPPPPPPPELDPPEFPPLLGGCGLGSSGSSSLDSSGSSGSSGDAIKLPLPSEKSCFAS